MKLDINNYPGSKGGSGIPQWIINHIPSCKIFIEGFGGSGEISWWIKKAKYGTIKHVYILEAVKDVVLQLKKRFTENSLVEIMHLDFFVKYHQSSLKMMNWEEFVFYLDPPYLKESRKSQKDIYAQEWTTEDHYKFFEVVEILNSTGAKIIISHYDCDLYRETLEGWHTKEMQTMTRGGTAIEKIWMNYDITEMDLAITDHVGKNFTDRQRIDRRKKSFLSKLQKMPRHEKQAVLEHIKKYL